MARRRRPTMTNWQTVGGVSPSGRRVEPFSRVGLAPNVGVDGGQFVDTRTGQRWNPNAYTATTAQKPPPALYDPALEQNRAGAETGYFDLGQDVEKQDTRDVVDYGYERGQIQQRQQRGQQDLGESLARGNADYSQSLNMLTRAYSRKEGVQRQQAARSGVVQGGALLQAAAKRANNMAVDRQPIDTSHTRFVADNSQSLSRLNDDTSQALGRLDVMARPADPNNPDDLGGRAWQDRHEGFQRAGRDLGTFEINTDTTEAAQAGALGWAGPYADKPSNEFIDPITGASHRTIVRGNTTLTVDPSGKVLARRKRARR